MPVSSRVASHEQSQCREPTIPPCPPGEVRASGHAHNKCPHMSTNVCEQQSLTRTGHGVLHLILPTGQARPTPLLLDCRSGGWPLVRGAPLCTGPAARPRMTAAPRPDRRSPSCTAARRRPACSSTAAPRSSARQQRRRPGRPRRCAPGWSAWMCGGDPPAVPGRKRFPATGHRWTISWARLPSAAALTLARPPGRQPSLPGQPDV